MKDIIFDLLVGISILLIMTLIFISQSESFKIRSCQEMGLTDCNPEANNYHRCIAKGYYGECNYSKENLFCRDINWTCIKVS